MMLRTHSVMAFILALTAVGMFFHLYRLRQPVKAKNWLMTFYFGLFCWQTENVIRYSMPASYDGTLPQKISVAAVLIPSLSLTLLAHTQYLYQFLVHLYIRESRVVLKLSFALFLFEFAFVIWNEFYAGGNIEFSRFSAFLFASVFSLWMISVALRKAFHMLTIDPRIAEAHFIYAIINGCYVIGSSISVAFGFMTVAGSWSYFIFLWLGNLASIVLYISTAAVPASFQTKITGFTFVVAATILCIVTLAFYPPDSADSLYAQMVKHQGLMRLMIITVLVSVMIWLLLPFMLNISLTNPLKRLVIGVQQVNEGKLDTKVEIGLMDEIGLLTQNFNQMTQSLKKAQEESKEYARILERKVVERTAQLEQSLKDLRAAQAQLIQTEKMAYLGELTAGIAHEIKNPVNFIVNFSELTEDLAKEVKEEVGREAIDKGQISGLLDDIMGNIQKIGFHGKRASNIVNSMLVHSRTSKGLKVTTDINDLVETYLRTSYEEMLIKNKSFNAVMQKQYDPDVGMLEVIPEDIGRVLLNLFSNAFYAVEEKKRRLNGEYEPTIQVITKKANGKVELCVKDNGIGIAQNVVDKIYQPFFTTKPTGEGAGLGLSLSYEIITKGHGGELIVESKEGQGTTFRILLPVQKPAPI